MTDTPENMLKVSVIRSRQRKKSIAVEVRPDGTVLVRAPLRASEAEIRRFLEEKQDWLKTHMKKAREQAAAQQSVPGLTGKEISALASAAMKDLPERTARFAPLVGVSYGRITIRNQRSRWGSCSVRGNLNFNCLLMLAPAEIRDYVVVHELCHRKQMNHSALFWAEVERILPDYRARRAWLRENGSAIMLRMTGTG